MDTHIWDDSLLKQGKYTTLKQGEVLHSSDDICRSLGRVEKGVIRISRILRSGKEVVLKELYPGEYFAELIVFSGEKYPGWLIASEDTVVVEVGLNILLNYLKNEDSIRLFLSGISQKVTELTNSIEILSLKTIKQKLAYLMLYNENRLKEPVNISLLSLKLGCSREALSRAISEMESNKMISKKDGCMRISDEGLIDNLFI